MISSKFSNNELMIRNQFISNCLEHVPFDGWSDLTYQKAISNSKLDADVVKSLFPRRGVDLALAFHDIGDEELAGQLGEQDFSNHKVKEKVLESIMVRLVIASLNKEAVKRSVALFATPIYFAEGPSTCWRTADVIWNSLGDDKIDLNWYTKRLMLSSIYSTCLIFWLDDESKNFSETREFAIRRIEEVLYLGNIVRKFKDSSVFDSLLSVLKEGQNSIQKHKENLPGWKK